MSIVFQFRFSSRPQNILFCINEMSRWFTLLKFIKKIRIDLGPQNIIFNRNQIFIDVVAIPEES